MNLYLKAWVSPPVHVYYWQYLCSILQEPSFFIETVKNLDLWQEGKTRCFVLLTVATWTSCGQFPCLKKYPYFNAEIGIRGDLTLETFISINKYEKFLMLYILCHFV
jgi:hypothetical protein